MMTNRMATGALFLALAAGLAGCSDASPASPTAPSVSQAPQAATPPASCYAGGSTLTGVTLFGVVFETTLSGQAPLAGVTVYCDACGEGGHTWAETDANGYYSFGGDLSAGGGIWLWQSGRPIALHVSKQGYGDPAELSTPSACLPSASGWREVEIDGDTRFDMQLVRQ